jgi:dynein light intermediate chain 1
VEAGKRGQIGYSKCYEQSPWPVRCQLPGIKISAHCMYTDGAALFYTTPTQPATYTRLRQYLLHRLHTIPPPLNPPETSSIATTPHITERTRFPFSHRANVLDRDAVMVPSGWDSWGKINVLREGFDPSRVSNAWTVGLSRVRAGDDHDVDGEEGIEDMWVGVIPNSNRGSKVSKDRPWSPLFANVST